MMTREAMLSWAGRSVVIAITVACAALLAVWAITPKIQPSTPVAQQWVEAVSQFGIEPAYPPQEDLSVGDIFAFITADAKRDLRVDPLPLRAIKLWHVDLTSEIEQAYRTTYLFPDTAERPAANKIWQQTPGNGSVFKLGQDRRALPLVVLPGFTVATVKSGAIDAGGITGLAARLGLRAGASSTMSVKVEGAETYGIPAIPAEWKLAEFCNEVATKPVCSDAGLRRQLSMIAGADIYELMPPDAEGRRRPRFSIELGLVSRVFLIRSIETVIERDSGLTGKLASHNGGDHKTGPDENASLKSGDQPPSEPNGTAPAASATSPKETSAARLAVRANAQAIGLAAVSERPGVSTTVQRGDASTLTVTQALQRPVVIGFRTVRWQVGE